ncbi:MAG: TetR/AcrR family transcriptional regulator [Myxococcales bacterium]|nr:TetR/AcrR family transcriptional regulator [Myxococcales bacterium]
MPRSPKDNQELRDARREQILAAAIATFAERGFGAARVSQVAAAAGLSHGLVYHYFENKEAMLCAIADAVIDRVSLDYDGATGTPLEKIAWVLDRTRERLEADTDVRRVLLQATLQGSLPPKARESLLAKFSRFHAIIRDWIAEAQERGDVDPTVPPEELAYALQSLIRGVSLMKPLALEEARAVPSTATMLRLLHPSIALGAIQGRGPEKKEK